MSDKKPKLLREFFQIEKNNMSLLEREERKAMENGDEVYLTGLMAKAGELNGNGRRYPKDILKREIENYRKLVSENRALGECVEEGSKILTGEGWKDFRELSGDEYIQTLNTKTNEIEYQKCQRVVEKEPEHDYLIHFSNRNIDIKVTPGHRFYLINRYGEGEFVKARDILENRSKYNKHYIPKKAGRHTEQDNKKFKISKNLDYDEGLNFLHLSTANGIYLDRPMKVEKVKYNKEKVYCVTVPNSTFYCMSPDGHCFWSANCDHPDESVVSLQNASHLVKKMWWKGPNEVWGKIKLLDTSAGKEAKALIEGGVRLGISSRGLGSVREQNGDLVVEDDFQLIAFDLVSDPSTSGAFMLAEGKDPRKDVYKNGPFKKSDKINRILNDILI